MVKAQTDENPEGPTVRAVVAYAAKLRAEGDREAIVDPYASPYRPSEASARKLNTRMGSQAALDYLQQRAAMHGKEVREDAVKSQWTMERHHRRQKQWRQKRAILTAGLSLGQRTDRLLNELRVCASPKAASLGGRIKGGDSPSGFPEHRPDELERAERDIRQVLDRHENVLFGLKTRDMDKAA